MHNSPDSFHAQTTRTVAGLVLASALAVGLLFLLWPFVVPLTTGVILALMCRPLYEVIHRSIKSSTLCVTLTLSLVILLFLIPFLITLGVLLREIGHATSVIQNQAYSFDLVNQLAQDALGKFGIPPAIIEIDFRVYLLSALQFLAAKSSVVIGGVLSLVATGFLALITAFYTLQNHATIRELIKKFSPLNRQDTSLVYSRAKEVIQATVSGNLVLLAIQTLSSIVGLSFFGIDSPVLLGVLYGITSMVPTVGTSLVWVPISFFQLLQGDVIAAFGVAIWSIVQIILYDNILGPKLIEKRARLHPFLVLLGVLGGVSQLGVLGIILGPTLIALGIVGLEILRRSWQAHSG